MKVLNKKINKGFVVVCSSVATLCLFACGKSEKALTIEQAKEKAVANFDHKILNAKVKNSVNVVKAEGIFSVNDEDGTLPLDELVVYPFDPSDFNVYKKIKDIQFSETNSGGLRIKYDVKVEDLFEAESVEEDVEVPLHYTGVLGLEGEYNAQGYPVLISIQYDMQTSKEFEKTDYAGNYIANETYTFSEYTDTGKTYNPEEDDPLDYTDPEIEGSKDSTNANDDVNLKDWMQSIPDEVPITQINMPGSHDSGTGRVLSATGVGFVKTQKSNIMGQLENGVRAFDFRILYSHDKGGDFAPVQEKITLTHSSRKFGLFHCYTDYPAATFSVKGSRLSIADCFKDITNFLNDHPKEFVFVNIKGDSGAVVTKKEKVPGGKKGEYREIKYYDKDAEDLLWPYIQKTCGKVGENKRFVILDQEQEVPTIGQLRGKAIVGLNRKTSYIGDGWTIANRQYSGGHKVKQQEILNAIKDFSLNKNCDKCLKTCADADFRKWNTSFKPRVVHFSCFRTPSDGFALNPLVTSNHMKSWFEDRINDNTFKKGMRYGAMMFDYVSAWTSKKIIALNPDTWN